MGKRAFRYVSYGECPKCGAEHIRNPVITLAVCTCESAIKVPLKPTILFRTNSRLYKKIERICEQFKIEIQRFVPELLCLGVKELEKLSAEEQRELLAGGK